MRHFVALETVGSNPTAHPTQKARSLILEIRLRVCHIGLSPSGKATDFDSVIPWVRIPPAQPCKDVYFDTKGIGINVLDFCSKPPQMAVFPAFLRKSPSLVWKFVQSAAGFFAFLWFWRWGYRWFIGYRYFIRTIVKSSSCLNWQSHFPSGQSYEAISVYFCIELV